jgi:osmoprotectant transport system permease protein
MGSQMLFDALAQGDVDVYVDYTGTIWTNVMKRTDMPSRRQMMVEMKRWLAQKYDITVAGRLGFENTYAMAMRRDRAKALGIKSISDLRSHAPNLKLGGDVEFFGRPEWKAAKNTYDLSFQEVKGLDASIMYSACEEGAVDVIAAFSSDGRIAAYDLVVLRDDQNVFPPYDAVVLLSKRANDRPDVLQAVTSLVNMIDDDLMRRTNKLVDVDGQSPAEAARFLLSSISDEPEIETIKAKTEIPVKEDKPEVPESPKAPKLEKTSIPRTVEGAAA